MELRRTQLDISVLKTENSVSNPSGILFPDGLETELSFSIFDFSCSGNYSMNTMQVSLEIMCNCILCENLSTMNNEYCEFECLIELGFRLLSCTWFC